ncbi:MAG: C45 family peptidase, partial [Bacillota bacterium]
MRQRYIEVQGTDYERGFQIGRLSKYEILTNYTNQVRYFKETWKYDFGIWKEGAKQYLPIIEEFAPRTLNEMRGMAEGAEVDLETILAITTFYELIDDYMMVERCTAFAVTGQATKHGGTFCGQTNDEGIDEWMGGDLDKVICHRAADNTQTLIYSHPGVPAMMGMNSSGLGVLWTYIDNGERQLGLPSTIINRELLYHTSLNEAVKYLQTIPHGIPNNYVLAHNKEGICSVECFPTSTHVVSSEISLCHSNHILTKEKSLYDVFNGKEQTASTFNRLKVMQELLKKSEGKIDVEIAKSFLADHSGEPLSICAHPRINDLMSKTLAAIVFDLEK